MALSIPPLVLQNLNTFIQTEMGLLCGLNPEMMKRLSNTLLTIHSVLEDADLKQSEDKELQNWVRRLKDLAYELDDILDDCKFTLNKKEVITSCFPCLPTDNVLFRHNIRNRMKDVTDKLDAISKEQIKFHLCENPVEFYERGTGSGFAIPQMIVYGRDQDKEKIVQMLVCDHQEVSFYPIIGVGGIGKTTLAQMVFDDKRVRHRFHPKIWVSVSESLDVKRVMKAIIKCVSGVTCKGSDLDYLREKLVEVISGKRYFLVLDDAWDKDEEKWEVLKYVLACGSKGASVVVTTRVEKVATIVRTLPPHHLSVLSEGDCWLLFRQCAFGHGNEESPNLVAIGKEIVKKCGGVPLAVKALGGLMRFKSNEKEWVFIRESEIWKSLQNESNSIPPAVKLSYYNLPLELRQCFAYCAVFPKGSEIDKENLIHLWMANGFISSHGNLEVEDIGNGIWNELCWRSFFQDVVKDSFGRISFRIHDLLYDLAQSVMEDECCMMEAESSSNMSKQRIRHVTLIADYKRSGVFPKSLHGVESLRTILQQYRLPYNNGGYDLPEFTCDFTDFGSLRVFDARGAEMIHLSSSVGNSNHLRYINLSDTFIRTIPKAICSLHNLQTLNLNYCVTLQRLPKNFKNLRSLRHLYLKGCWQILDMPPKLGQLTQLKTLSLFVVGTRKGCRLDELQRLDLGGELRIRSLDRVRNPMDAKEANLIGKKNLRILELSWGRNSESKSQANVENILEALEPHPNVEELFIENYRGAHFPLWMRDSVLKNVDRIELHDCRNCLVLPALWQLPLLRRLKISRMDLVEYIDNGSSGRGPIRGFPSLKALHISEFPNLKGLSKEDGREIFPRLRSIYIESCPKLTLPHLSSLEMLAVRSCSNVVPSSIPHLNCLTSLRVSGDQETISFPEEILQSLTVLEILEIESCTKLKVLPTSLASLVSLRSFFIINCPELESLPDLRLQSLKSLRRVEIDHCNNLSSLPESLGQLAALETLTIWGCSKLVALPESINHLTSLRSLNIRGRSKRFTLGRPAEVILCSKSQPLPEAVQYVPALKSLEISDYPELTSLPEWLGNLTSLQSLRISSCPKLPSLPCSFGSLTGLHTLIIRGCNPELARRCENGKGEDWFKIAHIQQVSVYEPAINSKLHSIVRTPAAVLRDCADGPPRS